MVAVYLTVYWLLQQAHLWHWSCLYGCRGNGCTWRVTWLSFS